MFGVETHPLKEAFKGKILERFLSESDAAHTVKWLPLMAQILLPFNEGLIPKLPELLPRMVAALRMGSKVQQVSHLSALKTFLHSYIVDAAQIEQLLLPCVDKLTDYIWAQRGSDGIRVSAFLSLFIPPRYANVILAMVLLPSLRLRL
jgi:hypothetical protein